jgi:hypothetical protein
MSKMTGAVPVTGALIPILLTFADPKDAGSARLVAPDDVAQALGEGFRLRGVTVEVVPNGWWPIDFGGPLGEPVTRAIEARLPWLNGAADASAVALRATGLKAIETIEAKQAFTRK